MTFKLGLNYISKARTAIKTLNKRIGKKGIFAFFSYIDFLWSFIIYGCVINQYVNGNFWRYRAFERRKVLTQRRVESFIRECNDYKHTYKLNSKVEFNRFFAKFIGRQWLASETMTYEEFITLLNSCSQLIIKSLDGMEGQGIAVIDSEDILIKGFAEKEYNKLKTGKFILEERIYNHRRMSFNNKSINTLRINTLLDKDGNVYIFKPVLRAGVGESVVDNYSAGGCEYAIDVETGIIKSLRYGNYVLDGLTHPGCDIIMPGYKIPMWKEVVSMIKEACLMIPECRFIGWDVAITEKGPQLIEGNHNPGIVGIEYFGETGWYDRLKKYI